MVIDLMFLFQCKLKMYNVCKKRIYFARDTVKKKIVFHLPPKRLKNKKNELINKKQAI